jgi:hypothetical protein
MGEPSDQDYFSGIEFGFKVRTFGDVAQAISYTVGHPVLESPSNSTSSLEEEQL